MLRVDWPLIEYAFNKELLLSKRGPGLSHREVNVYLSSVSASGIRFQTNILKLPSTQEILAFFKKNNFEMSPLKILDGYIITLVPVSAYSPERINIKDLLIGFCELVNAENLNLISGNEKFEKITRARFDELRQIKTANSIQLGFLVVSLFLFIFVGALKPVNQLDPDLIYLKKVTLAGTIFSFLALWYLSFYIKKIRPAFLFWEYWYSPYKALLLKGLYFVFSVHLISFHLLQVANCYFDKSDVAVRDILSINRNPFEEHCFFIEMKSANEFEYCGTKLASGTKKSRAAIGKGLFGIEWLKAID